MLHCRGARLEVSQTHRAIREEPDSFAPFEFLFFFFFFSVPFVIFPIAPSMFCCRESRICIFLSDSNLHQAEQANLFSILQVIILGEQLRFEKESYIRPVG
ncbi:hypothetical protein LZ32DRAFT_407126 [Colletotrichum eremochloae]|nr:hypothetical protein LZ32DRAFT_407126 [Colletotrichum eremochloae]